MHSALYTVLGLLLICSPACLGITTEWLHWGGNKENWRYTDHACVDSKQLSTLSTAKPLWKIKTAGTVAATPGVCGGFVYFVDWRRTIAKVTTKGAIVWSVDAKDYLPKEEKVGVRVTPVFSADCKVMYVATQWTEGPYLLAISTANGKLVYAPVKLDDSPNSRVTSSPTFHGGQIIVGISSNVENNFELTKCCTWRGSVVSVTAATGKKLWQTYTLPAGWSGGPVWGSSPAVDADRGQVCVGTGNLYSIPKASLQCLKSAPDGSPQQQACWPKNVYNNAVICLDLKTGTIKWGTRVHGLDIWGNTFDPSAPQIKDLFPKYKNVISMDYDFAQAPIYVKNGGGAGKDLLVVSSKGGVGWGFDAATGKIVWSTTLSLPSDKKPGFSMFGSCTNGKTFCSGLHWFGDKPIGRVVCMNVATGKKIWAKDWEWKGGVFGPLTCSQKHVFAPTLDTKGTLAILDITTGQLLGSFKTGASLFCGPAIVNGTMYVGQGYGNGGQPGEAFMAVALPGCSSAAKGGAVPQPVKKPAITVASAESSDDSP